jgi:hypothetical protein
VKLQQAGELRFGGFTYLKVAALGDQLPKVNDILASVHAAREYLTDMTIARVSHEQIAIAHPLGRLLPHKKVAAATDDVDEHGIEDVLTLDTLQPHEQVIVVECEPAVPRPLGVRPQVPGATSVSPTLFLPHRRSPSHTAAVWDGITNGDLAIHPCTKRSVLDPTL